MKNIIAKSSAVLATGLVMFGLMALPALATTQIGVSLGGGTPQATYGGKGGGAMTSKYSAIYDNGVGGHWVCSGVRVVNKTSSIKGFDSFTCTISDLNSMPAGTYTQANSGWGWLSDYNNSDLATSWTFVVTANLDSLGNLTGTGTVSGVANY